MNKGKRLFMESKVRTGVRPTRANQPLPSAIPQQGGSTGGSKAHYVMPTAAPDDDEAFHAGMGADAYPLPMNQHAEIDLAIADIPIASLPGGFEFLPLILAPGTAADELRVDWLFTVPAQESVFDIDIRVNGQPFINRRWTKPYNQTQLINFFRKMDTESRVSMYLVLKPGAVLVPPLGNICAWIVVDGYRAAYRG